MQGPRTKSGLFIGFDALLLSFLTNGRLLFTVSLCLGPPGQTSGISNSSQLAPQPLLPPLPPQQVLLPPPPPEVLPPPLPPPRPWQPPLSILGWPSPLSR